MGTINPYVDLIVPLNDRLSRDTRFAGINIFYDRSSTRSVPRNDCPAINFWLQGPWEDVMRGSGSYSLQSRWMDLTMGFGIWVYGGNSPAELDQQLFQVSSDLFDFFRDNIEFNQPQGIVIDGRVPIRWDLDYSGDENNILGTQRLLVAFKIYSGSGR